ncbi:MAG: hypothetical protein J5I57_05900 [Melioribacteraceae bacterium]|nr:hypothetical protein [Melioribacteraceae bacterium]
MINTTSDHSKIVHISREVHSQLKKFVIDKQIAGTPTTLSRETEKAIIQHLSKSAKKG